MAPSYLLRTLNIDFPVNPFRSNPVVVALELESAYTSIPRSLKVHLRVSQHLLTVILWVKFRWKGWGSRKMIQFDWFQITENCSCNPELSG